ncbi:PDGLE domain-containing protein [Pelodictyon luteolum]|nr:PDGLE domain-containing protein [Pelodictyon luteolum]
MKLWIGIGILALMSPLGLILPAYFRAEAAWGEWGADEIRQMNGYLPEGLARLTGLWKAMIPDYAFQGWEEKGLLLTSIAYVFSAITGIALITATTLIIGKILARGYD